MRHLPVVFVMGPTASGKTSLAMELVQRLDADIISVDSAMIYRTMDIGTAKPTADELARAPHALIDLLDPSQSWSVGEFCASAQSLIERSHRQGRVPLLTGGTMMYFRAFESGLNALPQADADTRAQINQQADTVGWPALHAELERLDPEAAARIHPNDAQRIQRALEVFRVSGRPISAIHNETTHPLPYPVLKFALSVGERSTLHERIHQRFDQMIELGFVDEVASLHARGDLHADLPSIRCVGYRQLWAYLEGDIGLADAITRGKTATRQLAKRQLTWLRSSRDLTTVDPLSPSAAQTVAEVIQAAVG
ncbi:MAG: tRNA (adenosine(37)-N6)-dimethylallyltransferase MiaA [Pseudomonadota bacterium]